MKKLFIRIFKSSGLISLLLLVRLFTNQTHVLSQESLKISAIPDQNPERLNRMYKILANELSKELQVPVKYIPVINYSSAVTSFRTKNLDLVWFGGLTGVQARLQTPGSKALAQRDIDAEFYSVFIANHKSNLPVINDIDELSLLRGKRFTFGSESSTSGRLMPQYYLKQAKVSLSDFQGGRPGFSGSHDATIALVQSGSYEAGALNEQVWEERLASGEINSSKLKVIWRTPPYFDYHWVVQPDLDNRFGEGFTDKLQNFFLNMNKRNSSNQRKILKLFGAKKFIPAYNYQYKEIETIGREIGKIR